MHTLHIGKWLEYYFQRQFALSNHQFSNISSGFRFFFALFFFISSFVIAAVVVVGLLLHHLSIKRICANEMLRLHVNIVKTELCHVEIVLQHRATHAHQAKQQQQQQQHEFSCFDSCYISDMNSIGILISRSTCWPCIDR